MTVELYKVVGINDQGFIVQVSDLHEWDQCEGIFREYLEEREDIDSIDIVYVGCYDD